jgi:hypothetical protein
MLEWGSAAMGHSHIIRLEHRSYLAREEHSHPSLPRGYSPFLVFSHYGPVAAFSF